MFIHVALVLGPVSCGVQRRQIYTSDEAGANCKPSIVYGSAAMRPVLFLSTENSGGTVYRSDGHNRAKRFIPTHI